MSNIPYGQHKENLEAVYSAANLLRLTLTKAIGESSIRSFPPITENAIQRIADAALAQLEILAREYNR